MNNRQAATDSSFWNDDHAQKAPVYKLRHHFYGKNGMLAKKFSKNLEGKKDVLELGCGSSKYLMFFNLVIGLETYGIDFSSEGIENLDSMSEPWGIKHQLARGDFLEESVGGRKFDVVFHAGFLEHFGNPDCVIERSRFFLKDNGLLIFTIPNFSNLAWRYHKRICPLNASKHIRYSLEDIERTVVGDFELVDSGFWGYPVLYAGGRPETLTARFASALNLLVTFLVRKSRPHYPGCSSRFWASTAYFVCRAK